MIADHVIIRTLPGLQSYEQCWHAMQSFTQHRTDETVDELWLLEHAPVFTQGQNGKPEHILNSKNIPVIQTDRGGQVTYHGPGQLMVYTLIDVKRKKLSIRQLVSTLEQAVIDLLQEYGIEAKAKCDAPGVYIDGKKICSVGLRIRRGCSYHGIAFNFDMDLSPFLQINPCGFAQLEMTQFSQLVNKPPALQEIGKQLITSLMKRLGYTIPLFEPR